MSTFSERISVNSQFIANFAIKMETHAEGKDPSESLITPPWGSREGAKW